MKALTAKHAQYGSGRPIDLARAEPVVIAKHGRSAVVVMEVEEFERLKRIEQQAKAAAFRGQGRASVE